MGMKLLREDRPMIILFALVVFGLGALSIYLKWRDDVAKNDPSPIDAEIPDFVKNGGTLVGQPLIAQFAADGVPYLRIRDDQEHTSYLYTWSGKDLHWESGSSPRSDRVTAVMTDDENGDAFNDLRVTVGGRSFPLMSGRVFSKDPELLEKFGPELIDELIYYSEEHVDQLAVFGYSQKEINALRERQTAVALKVLSAAAERFKAADQDGNGVKDYWVGDVSGLRRIIRDGKQINLIDTATAAADASPILAGRESGGAELAAGNGAPAPRVGALFRVIPSFETADGRQEAFNDGTNRNADRFGICAFPARYETLGAITLIISEAGTLWRNDTQGKPVETFPSDPEAKGWQRVE